MTAMKQIVAYGLVLVVAGCSQQPAESPVARVAAPSPGQARTGKVTREMILLDGGSCDAADVCHDRKSQRNYDCDVPFYCVPMQ